MRSLQESDKQEFSTLEQVRANLRRKGFNEPFQPRDELQEIPPNLMDSGGDTAVSLFREYEAHYEYVTYQHALAELCVGEWKNNLALILAKLKRDGVEKEEIELQDEIIMARKTLQKWVQEETLLGARKSALHRRMALVSRAVEAMKVGYQGSTRSGNIGLSDLEGAGKG